LTNGTTGDVTYWESINLRVITTPEVIGMHRLTVELFKDGDTNPYWNNSRFANPYCCFTSAAGDPDHTYDSWKEDVDNPSVQAPPPVPGNYEIKVTLTDTQQNPIEGEDPFVVTFIVTGSTAVNNPESNDITISLTGNQLQVNTIIPGHSTVQVYNIGGALQLTREFNQSEFFLDTNFPIGIYLVKVTHGTETKIQKVMVK